MPINSKVNIYKNIKKYQNKPIVDYRFKIIYAIAMMSVIADHCRAKGSIELNIQNWFHYSSFHMPLFMFAAGYFFKKKNIKSTTNYILRKFKKLIFPIYIYNLFYGFYIQYLKKLGFRKGIRPFSLEIIFIKPFGGRGFRNILPSWFSSSLFFVEVYNILKRKIISILLYKKEIHELIYFLFDLFISSLSIIYSNKGYSQLELYWHILRFLHLNIYYQFGILYNKHLEKNLDLIRSDIYFFFIFSSKLCFHLYYRKVLAFYYGGCNYSGHSPFTVILISILGIAFWTRIGGILEPLLGKNYYINNIADNTFSIMINHILALDLVRALFATLARKTKYCKDFNFNRYYSLDDRYIYIPYNVLQAGIIYYLSCLILPIIIQKLIIKIKNKFINFCKFKK